MTIKRITEKDFSSSKWSGGQTDEFLILPVGASYKNRNFNMRLSSATVELEKSTFTLLPDVTRFICPLDNNLKLFHDTNGANEGNASNRKALADLKPFEVFKFSGNLPIVSEGKCRDFNLMLKGNCDGFMQSWNTKEEPSKELFVKEKSLLWIFSYDVHGSLLIENENTKSENIEIDKMQLITVEGLYGKIELTAKVDSDKKTKFIYGEVLFSEQL